MKLLPFFILIFLAGISCKKDNPDAKGTAALTVINAVVGSAPLVTNFSNGSAVIYAAAQKLNYGSYSASVNEFSAYDGITYLTLYQLSDTSGHSPLYNLSLTLPLRTIHTLFLLGDITSPDTLFLTDNPPYHSAADSTMGIRFVNASSGSDPVNIVLSTSPGTSEFSTIPYKGSTEFRNYPTVNGISIYTFQAWDALTNTMIGSFKFNGIANGTGSNTAANSYRFRNFTLALIGQPNSGQKLMLINNY